MSRRGIQWDQVVVHAVLILMVAGTLYPMYFMLNMSLKDTGQLNYGVFRITFPFTWSNYSLAYMLMWRQLLNTIAVTLLSGLPMLLFASFTAYVLARYKFPGDNLFFMALLGLMMIPGILTLIPAFRWVARLGLANSWWALILPYIAFAQAFNMFILKSFLESLPEEMFEAARMDGAGHVHLWRHFIVPLSIPILVTLGILHTLSVWNDYIWPFLTITNHDLQTVSAAVVLLNNSGYFKTAGRGMAGNVIAAVPLLIMLIFGMKSFISGITSGAVKL